jgi:hypothetical protein
MNHPYSSYRMPIKEFETKGLIKPGNSRIDSFSNKLRYLNQLPGAQRKPTAALALYLSGLEEILASLDDKYLGIFDTAEHPARIADTLKQTLQEKNIMENPRFGRYHFRYMGILLSNIGNCFYL